jgi:hypothetical protein
MTAATVFEPARYLSRLNGKDYLEVKWRLVWLRDRHPEANVDTQLVELTEDKAVFKATIEIPEGGRATGYGSETERDFRDFLEKAETKAIGRALAALGFGTQFCDDHNFGASEGRVVDAPVSQPSRPQPRDSAPASAPPAPVAQQRQAPAPPSLITEKQQGFVRNLMRDHAVSDELMHTMILVDYDAEHLRDLTKEQASSFIAQLQALPIAEEQGVKQEQQKGYETNQFAVPDEPDWMRSAAGDDRHTA